MMNRKRNLILLAALFLFVGAAAVTQSKDNDHVYWVITSSVKEGQLENLKALGAEMVSATQKNEPGTLHYDWNLSEDAKTCFFFEHYKDSAAVMVHTKTFGEKYADRIFTMIDIQSFEIFGNPSDEVKEVYAGFGAHFNGSIGGFTR
jgi:quinol monooxygenase YgiN